MQISLMGKAEADMFSPPTRQSILDVKALEEKQITDMSNREVGDCSMRFD
jgi:hypothetical protein